MTTDASKDAVPIRLVFELTRADHPRLYDDLIRFPMGTKRINRLRVLAYDGLLAQGGQLLANNLVSMLRTPTGDADEGCGAVTNGLFEPSHLE